MKKSEKLKYIDMLNRIVSMKKKAKSKEAKRLMDSVHSELQSYYLNR